MTPRLAEGWQAYAWLGGALVSGVVLHFLLFGILRIVARRTDSDALRRIDRHCRKPFGLVVPLLVLHFIFPVIGLPPDRLLFFRQLSGMAFIAAAALLAAGFVNVGQEVIEGRFRVDVRDNLQARRVHTQIRIFKKILVVVIAVVAAASILTTFERIRYLGTSILASAGILGIIVGIAAQRSIGALLAGIQVAVTQPIRIDDVVIVEGEWGRIEEMTLSYVVVCIWDERRLVVPISHFMEKPFQNWTRVSADLLGTVFVYVDYTVPVAEVREALQAIVGASEYWDRRLCLLQVTNATERSLELRALVSAADASSAWDLRCEVREKLVDFIQKTYPDGLPKLRAGLAGPDGAIPRPRG